MSKPKQTIFLLEKLETLMKINFLFIYSAILRPSNRHCTGSRKYEVQKAHESITKE